jgi:TonB family protein
MRLKLVIGSVVLHVVVALVLWAQSVWQIDQLEPGRDRLANLAVLDMPAPPQGSPNPTPKTQSEIIPKKHVVHDIRQPEKKKDDKPPDDTPPGDGKGKIGTDDPITGKCENPPCGLDEQKKDEPKPEPKPEPVPVVKKPKIVRPPDLEHMRISGETQVHPSEVDKMTMIRAGNPRTTAQFLLCIDERGAVASVKMQRSSGYADYDARLSAAIHAWRYRPYMVDNEAQPACSTVTFDYRM